MDAVRLERWKAGMQGAGFVVVAAAVVVVTD